MCYNVDVCFLRNQIMIKKRHFIIVISILLVGMVLGSIFDLQINQALFSKNNAFGLAMASFGVYPCYAGLAFIGGGLIATTLNRKDLPLFSKIISYGLAGLAYFVAVYLCGNELPSTNGFYNSNNPFWYWMLSYLVAAFTLAAVSVGAYFVCKKGDAKKLWTALLVMAVIFVLGLLPPGFIIKLIIHRPRYRYLVRCGTVEFHNWWDSCQNYKDYFHLVVDGFIIDKEEFKSFPSGHAGTAAIMMMFLPYASMFFNKLKGKETLLFYIGFAWTILMAFSRILVGAHYLSDVCMGSLIIMVVYFSVHVYTTKKGWIFSQDKEKEQPQE